MIVLVDTNVFVAALTDEIPRGQAAAEFLNQDHDFFTTIFNLMELRSVLAKKKRVERDEIEDIILDITGYVTIVAPSYDDLVGAYHFQSDTMLYPLDCLFLYVAEESDGGVFVTFDGEALEHGAKEPEEFLDG